MLLLPVNRFQSKTMIGFAYSVIVTYSRRNARPVQIIYYLASITPLMMIPGIRIVFDVPNVERHSQTHLLSKKVTRFFLSARNALNQIERAYAKANCKQAWYVSARNNWRTRLWNYAHFLIQKI